jgi:hypothetical protein
MGVDVEREKKELYVTVRCRPGFRAWVMEFAMKLRITPKLVEHGLEALARERRYTAPPER